MYKRSMPIALPRAVAVIIAGLFLVSSTTAFAKISKKSKVEINGYAEKNATVVDEEGKVAWLMTKGLLVSKKEASLFDAYKTNESEAVRLGAGLGLLLAGDRKITPFIGKQLASSTRRMSLLRLYVSALDDKKESKLLLELLKNAKPDVSRDYVRYLAETPEHFGTFSKLLKNKKMSKVAWAGFGALSPKATIKVAKGNLKNKDEAIRKMILFRLIAMADWPEYFTSIQPLLRAFAKGDPSQELKLEAAKTLVLKKDKTASEMVLKIANTLKVGQRVQLLKFLSDNNAKVSIPDTMLNSENKDEKQASYLLAAKGNKKLGKEFLKMYGDTEFDERLIAVQSVGHTKSAEAFKILTGAIFEGNRDIRVAAAKGLIVLEDPKTLDFLKRALLNEKDREIKLLVIDAIGATKSEEALQILRFQVTSRDRMVKLHTIAAIQNSKRSAGAKALGNLVQDRDREIQWAAFLALMELDAKAGKAQFKSIFRNPIPNYLDDVDRLPKAQRELIYDWMFKNGPPSVRQDATVRAMQYHQFTAQIGGLLNDAFLSTELRKDLIFHLLNSGAKNSKLYVESFARKSYTPTLTRVAIWGLARSAGKKDEATFRGLLNAKDKVAAAVAMFGFASLQ